MINRRSMLGAIISNEVAVRLPTLCSAVVNTTGFIANKFPRSTLAGSVHHSIKNWYEAGWPLFSSGKVSNVPELVQDSRWDQNYVQRREMLRRMRYWEKNSAIVESILSVGERYTVGASGLHVSFYPHDDITEDSDDSWYERADKVVKEWFHDCGWNGETMEQLLKIGYRRQKVDGESFYVKTRKPSELQHNGRTLTVKKPCLQLVEAHRVGNPLYNQFNQLDVTTSIDGVQYEEVVVEGRNMLKPVGFWVRSGAGVFEDDSSWQLIANENIWQLRNVTRADQPRSVSDFYSVEVTINKLEDTLEIEDKAHNSQSIRAVGIESASGQAATVGDRKIELISQAMGRSKPIGTSDDWALRQQAMRKETGAYVYGLKPGEKVNFDQPTRPSESTLNLIEYRVNSIAAGTKSPRCLIFEKVSGQSARGQGTEVRAQLDSGDAYYKSDFEKWKNFVREATTWFMEWAIKNDNRVSDPPADWKHCIHIQQPAACNVDYGYVTSANLMSLAAGASDYDMILGPLGINSMTVFKRLARQQKMIKKLGLKLTLPALMAGQIELDGATKQEPVKAE